jgi:hypothetical protein
VTSPVRQSRTGLPVSQALMWLTFPDGCSITRRVNRTPAEIRRRLADVSDFPAGRIAFARKAHLRVEPFTPADPARLPSWATRGRLYGGGTRLVRYLRAEIELTAYSATACELRIRPRCPHVHRWTIRRQRRWFELAGLAADAIAAAVVDLVDGGAAVDRLVPVAHRTGSHA